MVNCQLGLPTHDSRYDKSRKNWPKHFNNRKWRVGRAAKRVGKTERPRDTVSSLPIGLKVSQANVGVAPILTTH